MPCGESTWGKLGREQSVTDLPIQLREFRELTVPAFVTREYSLWIAGVGPLTPCEIPPYAMALFEETVSRRSTNVTPDPCVLFAMSCRSKEEKEVGVWT